MCKVLGSTLGSRFGAKSLKAVRLRRADSFTSPLVILTGLTLASTEPSSLQVYVETLGVVSFIILYLWLHSYTLPSTTKTLLFCRLPKHSII